MLFKDPAILFFEKRWEIKYFKFEEIKLNGEEKESLNVIFKFILNYLD